MTAKLSHISSGRVSVLRAEHLIGRSPRCDLCIDADYVSGQHAALRWNGQAWEIRDLGSRNGTQVDGERLHLGEARVLRVDATIGLGDAAETWRLTNAAAPQVMVISLESESVVLPEGEMLAVPSSQAPEAVLFRDAQGAWVHEQPDGALTPISDQDRFETRAGRWLFCCPSVVAPTSALETKPSLRRAALEFAVSMDEEHVEVAVRTSTRSVSLGARAHNYLLLILARHRLDDQAGGFLASACGWVYVEELLDELRMTPEQLNLEIFRIRQQFGKLGFDNPSAVIERRSRTRQLRLSIAELVVRSV